MLACRTLERCAAPEPALAPPEAANDALDFSTPKGELPRSISPDISAALFSPLEMLVIGIGTRDPLKSPARGSRVARLARFLFGIEGPQPFADRHLEALRSLTVALRRERGLEAAIGTALAAGITQQQVDYLRTR